MKRIILISVILMPYFLMAQSNSPQKKRPQEFVEKKKERFEYAVIRAVKQTQSVANTDKTVTPKKRGKSIENKSNTSQEGIENKMKLMQKARWTITFDFGRVKTKESQALANEQFYSIVDALNYMGSRGYELSLSEFHDIDQGMIHVYYMRRTR